MLISFSVSNFKSILEPVCLNMLADSEDPALCQNLYEIKSIEERVCPFSVIMGANGSGKSSIVEALKWLRSYVVELQPPTVLPQNRMKGACMQTIFNVTYYVENSNIGKPFQKFVLTVSPDYKFYECLMVWEDGDWQIAYENEDKFYVYTDEDGNERCSGIDVGDAITFHDKRKDLVDFFNNLIIINSIDTIIDSTLLKYFGISSPGVNLAEKIKKGELFRSGFLCEQDVFKAEFMEFMNNLGINITDACFEKIEVEKPKKTIVKESEKFNEQVEEMLEKYYSLYNKDWVETFFGDSDSDKTSITVYKLKSLKYQNYEVPIEEESSGTRRIVMIIYFILNLLLKDNSELVLFIDEMDAGLHDTLAKEIVGQYFDICKRRGRKASQLVITSHNTVLMRDIPLRKDQIWFTEMKEDRTTDLFSLAEIKDVRSSEDFAENYLRGKYGALPQIKKWMRKSEADDE